MSPKLSKILLAIAGIVIVVLVVILARKGTSITEVIQSGGKTEGSTGKMTQPEYTIENDTYKLGFKNLPTVVDVQVEKDDEVTIQTEGYTRWKYYRGNDGIIYAEPHSPDIISSVRTTPVDRTIGPEGFSSKETVGDHQDYEYMSKICILKGFPPMALVVGMENSDWWKLVGKENTIYPTISGRLKFDVNTGKQRDNMSGEFTVKIQVKKPKK